MRYFARINAEFVVEQVIVLGDEKNVDWLSQHLPGDWVETFTDGGFRKNYAGVGFSYDEERDAFIPPKPYDSWILDEETCLWEAPIEYPSDGQNYYWDESIVNWELVEAEEE